MQIAYLNSTNYKKSNLISGSLMSEFPAAPPDDYGMTLDAEDGTVAEFRDPVSVVFGGHGGRVIDVRCSPFHRDIFASAGSDHEGIPDF